MFLTEKSAPLKVASHHKKRFNLNCDYIIIMFYRKTSLGSITGQLQVGPMLYTLYIDINLRVYTLH